MGVWVNCRGCGVSTNDVDRQGGEPQGWIRLAMNTPPVLDRRTDRPFSWLGEYCSLACVTADWDELLAKKDQLRSALDALRGPADAP